MKRELVLHGALSDFGGPFVLEVETAGEAICALCRQLDGFEEAIRAGAWRVVTERGDCDQERLAVTLGRCQRIEILPVAAGQKRGGAGKVLLGAALIGAAFAFAPSTLIISGQGVSSSTALGASIGGSFLTYSNVALFGGSLVLGGIASLLSPAPAFSDVEQFQQPDERASFLYNGPTNTIEEGGAIPLAFGRVRIGIRSMSIGVTAERV